MAYVEQKHSKDCGIACLAMLCDVSYEDAERAIPWRRQGWLEGTTTKQLREGAAKLGYRVDGDRMQVLGKKSWGSIPHNSLVKIPKPDSSDWHWVVWRKGKVYDPAVGVFPARTYPLGAPTSYLEFIKENDDA
jgi:ABC-type bacteriocin/lantibiotic exporter with double-glycine peptidase domain